MVRWLFVELEAGRVWLLRSDRRSGFPVPAQWDGGISGEEKRSNKSRGNSESATETTTPRVAVFVKPGPSPRTRLLKMPKIASF